MTSGGETPGIGAPGIPVPKTRMTRAYGYVSKSLSKTMPSNLGKARQTREQIRRSFRVPKGRGSRG